MDYFNLRILRFLSVLFILSCTDSTKKEQVVINTSDSGSENERPSRSSESINNFNEYWYGGEAEIASYKLEQARYGEMREGTAALIFVTEDFLPKQQVKADQQNKSTISVLKLNSTKNFNTGIYPYSIMQSTFFPVSNNQHAIKVNCSVQEWCGQVYTQLNNRTSFEIISHSYFQSEADQNFSVKKEVLENELWTQLRINPKSLPVGDLQIIPSFEYIRLKHIELKAYKAIAKVTPGSYKIQYPELNRSLEIKFNPNFPYDIMAWEETVQSGFGSNAKYLTTKATRLKLIKSAYWTKNSNENSALRDTLKLN